MCKAADALPLVLLGWYWVAGSAASQRPTVRPPSSLLEAEIVAADGATRIVNEAREPDLLWALKGGGGGTFGVVTRLTLATHQLPDKFGALNLTLQARSDEAYRRLLARFVDLYAMHLFNPHWGEQVRAGPDNRLRVSMVFQGISKDQATAAFKPLIEFANANASDYQGQNFLSASDVSARYSVERLATPLLRTFSD